MSIVGQVNEYISQKYPEVGTVTMRYAEIAVAVAESICSRKFAKATHTERTIAYRGMVFVSNTPLHDVVSVKDVEMGYEFNIKSFIPEGIIFLEYNNRRLWVEVKYVGGYETLPNDLVFAIGELAYYLFKHEPNIESLRGGDFTVNIADLPQVVLEVLNRYRGEL